MDIVDSRYVGLDLSKKTLTKANVRQRVRIPISFLGVEECIGEFVSFNNLFDGKEHIAICIGKWRNGDAPLVRLHSECLTGDVFGSARCDCGSQLREAMLKLSKESGIILYLRQEGRGIGLYNKLDAYVLQDKGVDTYEANAQLTFPLDMRDYRCAAQMLYALGVNKINLLSNNPDKADQLRQFGIDVQGMVSTSVFANPHNKFYLKAKVLRAGHKINLEHYLEQGL
jgi:GTP cyclohydrolase II